jgi:hypothetical protein
MTIAIQITYDVTTHESAEEGDTADNGFYGPGGWKYSISDDSFYERVEAVGREQALKDMTPDPVIFNSVEEAVGFIQRDGPFEASSSAPYDEHTWLTQSGPIENRDYFEKGEHCHLSYHITASPEVHAEIIGALV